MNNYFGTNTESVQKRKEAYKPVYTSRDKKVAKVVLQAVQKALESHYGV